ncbi:PadR family transcriptional regulator [Thermococcus stetteri]|uniref:PadR family transcriptional regulator n=1 Tax=Thermococcus stetteri TaxID=49900 RepID=UPI001AE3B950|nr:helix-turn-helix transcriptional regulator [Thermococcus stetteri]
MIRRIILGFMGIHVLHHASKGEVTGSIMMEELKRHGYNVSPGTIYPLLHRMEEMGLLKSKWEVKNRKRVRLYRATSKGEELLEEARKKVWELCSELLEE